MKGIRNLFRLEKENKQLKYKILRDNRNLLEHEEDEKNYYKSLRVSNFLSIDYIECKINSSKNKTLLVEVYFNKIRPYLKYIVNNLKT